MVAAVARPDAKHGATRRGPEEKRMLERFGEEYHQYMKKTVRRLPRIGK